MIKAKSGVQWYHLLHCIQTTNFVLQNNCISACSHSLWSPFDVCDDIGAIFSQMKSREFHLRNVSAPIRMFVRTCKYMYLYSSKMNLMTRTQVRCKSVWSSFRENIRGKRNGIFFLCPPCFYRFFTILF